MDLEHAGHFTLLSVTPRHKGWQDSIEAGAFTTAEADDPAQRVYRTGMDWVAHMDTHAPSVVNDLGQAIPLDPELEPRCRGPLDRARAQFGDAAFDAAMTQARDNLRRA